MVWIQKAEILNMLLMQLFLTAAVATLVIHLSLTCVGRPSSLHVLPGSLQEGADAKAVHHKGVAHRCLHMPTHAKHTDGTIYASC